MGYQIFDTGRYFKELNNLEKRLKKKVEDKRKIIENNPFSHKDITQLVTTEYGKYFRFAIKGRPELRLFYIFQECSVNDSKTNCLNENCTKEKYNNCHGIIIYTNILTKEKSDNLYKVLNRKKSKKK